MAITVATKLGPYEIVALLGKGGMGEVWRARDTRLDRDVAIKVLPEAVSRDSERVARFQREGKVLASLNHPNVLALYDVGRYEDNSYVVMELLEGETLRSRINRSALPSRKAVEVGIAIADGLSAAHAKCVIHRDLKPENIFLTADGQVKILDFGLARSTGPAQGTTHDPASSLTLTNETEPGAIIGTLCYMAPEQVRGLDTDARTDIFSLGCVVYEMVAGHRAFTGDTPADIMTAILKEDPAGITDARTGIRPELERVIVRCLEKKPEQRFQSAPDLAFTLRSLLANTGAVGPPRRALPWYAKAGIVALVTATVLVGAFMVRRELRLVRREAGETIDSLAVLPLENVSRDPEQEIFVDGMTEALISDLAKIGGLKVISPTSVMRYKGTTKSLPEIARELNVEAVVGGSVLRVGDRVRITAQLIDATTDEHLWADSYERDLRDVLRLHSEVARTIAQEIKVTLTPQEQARMVEARPVNPEAHQAYLKGRFYWNKRTPDGLKKAVEYFEQVVALDPDWPLGYVGLADAYLLMPEYSAMHPSEAMPKARVAAHKALELDESLGEAHATLGSIAKDYDWDWRAAEQEFKRAIALSPNYATAYQWYAEYLEYVGRYDEALRAITKAQEVDPLSLIIGVVVGLSYTYAGDFVHAENRFRKTLELGPDFALAHGELAKTLLLQGRIAEAITEAREAVRLSNNDPFYTHVLGYVCAMAGQVDEARGILNELTARSKKTYVAPTHFALVHAGLDERDRMFDWLERAYQERDILLLQRLTSPLLAPMRSDPKFADLVRRVGLPPLAPALPPLPRGDKGGLTAGKIMLAVLPFENLSRDPDQEYFSDGLTEEMIAQLGRLNPAKLGVIARTSAMHYKNTAKTIDAIGRELGVAYVVEGSVRRAGDRLRITTKLLQVSDQTQLWSQEFDRTLEDVLAVQADVADQVARSLALELLPEAKALLSRTPQIDRAVHDLYLRGRSYWYRRTPAAMLKGIDHFNQVLERQPDHAQAYAALADSYNELAYHGHMAPQAAFPRSRAAAQKAVDLDETLAEPHASLAFVAYHFDWDWPTVDRELRRAIELNPSYAEAHHWYSHFHMSMGRVDQSLEESQRALAIDPLAMLLNVHLGWHYLFARQYDLSAKQLRETLELDRGLYPAHLHLGRCYQAQGLHADAVASLEEATRLAPESAQAKTFLAAAYAAAGRPEDAQKILDLLKEASQKQYVSACDIAAVYAAWGKADDAFAWLEKALEEHSARLVELTVDPNFDPLRLDPRFDGFVRRVGLPSLNEEREPVKSPMDSPTP